MSVSRAGGKLEAALDRFGLGHAVRGAQAVDVGASTGGFTEVLLARGAAHVVAVDVGRGQLAAGLRTDPRVTSLEDTDWKRLPLAEAPGPFDFFTVDVSFVAARNMLRGLAFRLRPGAAGVVLVKPQFELPDQQVRAGRLDDPADDRLRLAALDKVRRKAEALGFSLVDHVDSPVPGGSGTIEILAQLRFEGRPSTLPRPGERRRPQEPPARARAREQRGATLRWFAVVAPGLEEVAGREVAGLPEAAEVRVVPGGVEWAGPLATGYRANLWLRIATRVLARAGEVEAREFGKLRRRAARLDWGAFVPPGASLAAKVTATHCRLYHTGALAETVLAAVGDAVPGAHPAAEGEEPGVTIFLRGEDDRFTASVDASGERLHRRGARQDIGAAPLRETLAAGLLALCGFRPDAPLCDPMCGAGTIPIEACGMALDRAPGLERALALDAWPMARVAPATGSALRDEARARARTDAAISILASDRDPEMVAAARRNAERAGVGERITFACADVADLRPPADLPAGLLVTNPPYGRRMGDARALGRAHRDLGRALKAHFRGWRAGLLLPAAADPGALGLAVVARHRLKNGGLPVVLVVADVM